MSTNLRRLRSERVRRDAEALALSQRRLDCVLHEQEEANAALEAAQRVVDDLAREARLQRDLTNSLAARLEASRADVLQLCVAGLPDDVLRCVFEAYVSDGKAAAPFTLAAVCARWRRIALQSPAVWSTIRVRARVDALKPQIARVKTLLLRSASAPLHIAVTVVRHSLRRLPTLDDIIAAGDLFVTLGHHVSRWKTTSFTLYGDIYLAAFDCLKGPTPLLSELCIAIHGHDDSVDNDFFGDFFPFAPHLRELSMTGVEFACSPLSEFPVLEFLKMGHSRHPHRPLFEYLCRGRNSLLFLELDLDGSTSSAPLITLDLPRVEQLHFGRTSEMAPWSFRAPALTHLTLPLVTSNDIVPFLDAVSPTVQVLAVPTLVTNYDIVILDHLRNLEQLTLSHVSGFDDAALRLLADRSPPIWPRLTTVNSWPPDPEGWPVDAILHLIASRNAPDLPGHSGPGVRTPRPSKLRKITFAGEPPQWFVSEVERLLML